MLGTELLGITVTSYSESITRRTLVFLSVALKIKLFGQFKLVFLNNRLVHYIFFHVEITVYDFFRKLCDI